MRASGFHWRMMLRPLFQLLLPVALGLLLMGLFLSPLAASAAQKRVEEAFRNAAEWGLQPGTFHVLRGGDMVLYVESVGKDGRTLNHVFIQQRAGESVHVHLVTSNRSKVRQHLFRVVLLAEETPVDKILSPETQRVKKRGDRQRGDHDHHR